MEMMSSVAEHLHDHQLQMMMAICKGREKKQLSLEHYLSFLQTRDFAKFNVDQINMVVSIHGYKKLPKRKKAEEAVKEIELLHLARSTVKEQLSSSTKAEIKFSEAIKDLKALDWQECSITSITSVKPENDSIVATTTIETALGEMRRSKLGSSMSSGSGATDSGCSGAGNDSFAPVIPSLGKTPTTVKSRKPKRRRVASLINTTSNDMSGSSGGCRSSSLGSGGRRNLHAIG